jgi:hypothetical protein
MRPKIGAPNGQWFDVEPPSNASDRAEWEGSFRRRNCTESRQAAKAKSGACRSEGLVAGEHVPDRLACRSAWRSTNGAVARSRPLPPPGREDDGGDRPETTVLVAHFAIAGRHAIGEVVHVSVLNVVLGALLTAAIVSTALSPLLSPRSSTEQRRLGLTVVGPFSRKEWTSPDSVDPGFLGGDGHR